MTETKCAKCGGGGIVQRGLVVRFCDCAAGKSAAAGGDQTNDADTRRLTTDDAPRRRER